MTHEHPRPSPHASADRSDWASFAPVYDQHHAHLFRVAMLLCAGRGPSAEDVTAETLVDVFQAWAAGDVAGTEHVPAFARRRLVDHARAELDRQEVRNGAPPAASNGRGASGADDPFGTLGGLPADERVAVVLRYYEDLTYEQIAAAMDVTPAAAMTHVADGLARLRGQGRTDGDHGDDVAR